MDIFNILVHLQDRNFNFRPRIYTAGICHNCEVNASALVMLFFTGDGNEGRFKFDRQLFSNSGKFEAAVKLVGDPRLVGDKGESGKDVLNPPP
mmetsp:Transcript_10549/g.12700  ORF Transcript_10549/g.12700 Transcript_10549/m.12700 type:complete len:93 (+) Transcript_10549:100-378(+)